MTEFFRNEGAATRPVGGAAPVDGSGELHALLAQAPVAIVMVQGPNLVIELMNPLARQLLRNRPEAGRPLLECAPELADTEVHRLLARVVATGEAVAVSAIPVHLARRGDGALDERYFNVTIQRLQRANGKEDSVVGYLVEVTDQVLGRRRAEQLASQLASERDRLKRLVERRAEEAFMAQHDLMRTITDNAALGLVMLDARQRCTFMNPAAEKITGYTLDEIRALDRPFHDVIHHTRPDGTRYPIEECPIDRALPKRNKEQGEDVFVRKDGTFYPAAFTASPILEGDVPVGTVIEIRDIAEQKRAEAERERLIAALERTNAELDQFAYVASHDLKAPLRGIASLSSWIEEDLGDALAGESREQMQLLRGRVHRMEAFLDGILDYSRAGRARHKVEPVDVGHLLADVVDLLAPPPGARVEIEPGMPTLSTERVPLQQVLMNLIGNALKHARRADPEVRVSARDVGTHYEFAVSDNGHGIAPEHHERIWGLFQTLEARDRVESTGIGLAVVKKVIESRGGSISLRSSPGSGATFLFTWPKREGARC